MRKGLVLVVSAPSGAGKTTLCRRLLSLDSEISFSVSYTTRSPRPNERNGVDYFFVDKETFKKMINEGAFLEWAEVHGNFYGTSLEQVKEAISSGKDVLLDIDVQGAFQVREKLGREAVLVFILPPSFEELEKRLKKRGTEDPKELELRLSVAKEEIAKAQAFDYLIVNDVLEEALDRLYSILKAERQRTFRRSDLIMRFF
ncbi:guanylate kinase [Thermodesulfatator indicus DSM 15286]|uniref:Guanylate kinase n=1 Tax=Thermodesulfatator indicus (strain DSM 15286 / JCM 11887 / CIR29812) TaxID=667014 RepID=F8A8G4_THEID|nr:guanylate kinase [Thermodesulfatator indicus]AEH43970.1 guanylate kinase [Thermodesulfatator indicus DSM 15286]